MRITPLFSLILLAALPLAACDVAADDITTVKVSGSSDLKDGTPITAQAVDPGKFTALSAVGPDDVILKIGDSFSISATGNTNAIENLRFVVKDGQLIVGRYKSSWTMGDNDSAVITVTAPSISAISATGSGDVKAAMVSGDSVKLSSAGSGTLDVADIITQKLDANLAGSGNMILAGKVADASYSIAGSGDIEAAKLASSSAKVSVAGSGDAILTVSGSVNASIAGSGEVTVSGGAKCTSAIVGSGKLNCG
jgi:Putative auto-transporter adhesin, head GIN domain